MFKIAKAVRCCGQIGTGCSSGFCMLLAHWGSDNFEDGKGEVMSKNIQFHTY